MAERELLGRKTLCAICDNMRKADNMVMKLEDSSTKDLNPPGTEGEAQTASTPQTWLVTCAPYYPGKETKGLSQSTPAIPKTKSELFYICVFCQEKIVGKEQRADGAPACKQCYLAKVPFRVRRSVIVLPSHIDANDHMKRCQAWIRGFPDSYRVIDVIDYRACGIILYECPRTPVQE